MPVKLPVECVDRQKSSLTWTEILMKRIGKITGQRLREREIQRGDRQTGMRKRESEQYVRQYKYVLRTRGIRQINVDPECR